MNWLEIVSIILGILYSLCLLTEFFITKSSKLYNKLKNTQFYKVLSNIKYVTKVLIILLVITGVVAIILFATHRLSFEKNIQQNESQSSISSYFWLNLDEANNNSSTFEWYIKSNTHHRVSVIMFLIPYSPEFESIPRLIDYERNNELNNISETVISGKIEYTGLEKHRYRLCGLLIDKQDNSDLYLKCHDTVNSLPP